MPDRSRVKALRLRINLASGRAVGPGKIDLLELIGRTGSLSEAARGLRMSYRRAWLLVDDAPQSVTVPLRRGREGPACLCAFNCTPVARAGYRAGVDGESAWRLALDSDAREFGGGGHQALARLETSPRASHGRPWSVELVLPPLSALFYLEEPRTA